MSLIEELTEERDRLYQEHNETFQAWMDAEVALKEAIEDDNIHTRKVRKYLIFTVLGFVGATILAHACMV